MSCQRHDPKPDLSHDQQGGTMTTVMSGHVRLDAQGVAWIDDTNVKVTEVVLDRMANGWSPEEIHFQHQQRRGSTHRCVDSNRLPFDIRIPRADHDSSMSRVPRVQTDKLPPVQGQEGPADARGELEHDGICDPLIRLACLDGRQHIVSKSAERFA
jgi:hypothetical protein